KLGALAAVLVSVAGIVAWRIGYAEPERGDAVEQVVPFSHQHHVGENGIDCRYCHANVETGAFAGMPTLATCMGCHSQLYTDAPLLAPLVAAFEQGRAFHWRRVHVLPDFVYFDHAPHVANGVGCETCHGRVDRMALVRRVRPLTMRACLDCHRAPQRYLRPREREFAMGWQARDQDALGK